ncbi:MAG TPA: HEAT repeat domain-containing protein [Pedococcus sp.]
MTNGLVLPTALAGVCLGCLALAVLVVLTKVRRERREARRRALVAPHRRSLMEVASGEDPDGHGRQALAAVSGPARTALDETIVGMLGKIRGLPAEQLVDVLASHGELDRARADLRHRSPVHRARAAQVLGLSRDKEAVDDLVAALRDPSDAVRASAAYSLGLIGDPRAAGPLLEAVAAPGAGLPAGLAADALLDLGVGVSEALMHGLVDPDSRARSVAAHLCGVGAFTRPLPLLRDLVVVDPDLTVRETAAHSLGQIGRSEDVAVLARHTEADHPLPLRRVCAHALGDLADPAAVPTLAGLLHDPDPRLAELAAAALVRFGDAGRPALERAADHPPVRSAVIVARLQGVLA